MAGAPSNQPRLGDERRFVERGKDAGQLIPAEKAFREEIERNALRSRDRP